MKQKPTKRTLRMQHAAIYAKKDVNENKKKVRDHDHRKGCYRGAADDKYNMNYCSNRFLSVIFLYLKGYDSP